MPRYSMALNIEGWGCVVVGGGRIALERTRGLLDAGARVRVISLEFDPDFEAMSKIERRVGPFEDADLEGAFLAIAATNDSAVNQIVAEASERRGILCNTVDHPEQSQFIVPALVERGLLRIAVSTEGASPAFAARIREQLESWLPMDLSPYLEFLEAARATAKTRIVDTDARARFNRYLASAKGYAGYKSLDGPGRAQWVEKLIGDPGSVPATQ